MQSSIFSKFYRALSSKWIILILHIFGVQPKLFAILNNNIPDIFFWVGEVETNVIKDEALNVTTEKLCVCLLLLMKEDLWQTC